MPLGRPGWSAGTPRRCWSAVRARPCTGGLPPWPRTWSAPSRGDADATIQFAQQSLALADAEDQYLNYFGRWNLAVGTLLQGRVADAEAALGELAADLRATGPQRYFAVHAHYM